VFTQNEIYFILDCFNGVICDTSTLTGNIWGHVPFYSGPEVESINALISKVNGLSESDKDNFVSEVVCWSDYNAAKAYLESL
jgi:hypothetical protein